MKTGLAISIALGLALAFTGGASAQTSAPYKAPRAADGHPDLQGVWSNASLTNLTRPPNTKLTVTKTEAEALVKSNVWTRLAASEAGRSKLDDKLLDDKNSDRGYNTFWIDPGSSLAVVNGEIRTSWIVDPPNGSMPLTAEGRKMATEFRNKRVAVLFGGPEALPPEERCLIGFTGAGGPGMLNTIYNNNYQIVQTSDAVLIVVEMVHDARIVTLFKGKASAKHKPAAIKPWLGDSIGWWEGDTLVVETTQVNATEAQGGPIYVSPQGKVTERFTRVSDSQIFYQFEVTDPVYYTQTWKAEESLNARKEAVYEYACHEGNYAMKGILRGARMEEARGEKPTMGPGIFGTPIGEARGPAE
ncbi:MAG: hypothetical protein ABI740_00985 [Alphaproteobacteria bacterium]